MIDVKYSPLISVIVPIYNVGKYLNECLDSIKNQSYRNLEIIMVDDGSTDNSAEICKQYLTDDRFNYYYKENGGQSSARNIALDIANGEYVAFIDSDDFVDACLFEDAVMALQNNIADIIEFGYYIYGNTLHLKNINKRIDVDILKEYLLYGADVVWNKIYAAHLFSQLRFKEKIIYEDVDLLPSIFIKAETKINLNKSYYYYRQRNDSTVNKAFRKKNLDCFVAIDDLISVISENRPDLLKLSFAKASVTTLYFYCHFVAEMDLETCAYVLSKYSFYRKKYKETRGKGIKLIWKMKMILFDFNKRIAKRVLR